MARWIFNYAKSLFLEKELDLEAAVIKAALPLSTSTIPRSATSLSDLTLNEHDGASYARQTLANKTVTQNDTSNTAIFDADNISFGSLEEPSATFNLLLYVDGIDDDARIPLYFNSDSPFPRDAEAALVRIAWRSSGIFLIEDAT